MLLRPDFAARCRHATSREILSGHWKFPNELFRTENSSPKILHSRGEFEACSRTSLLLRTRTSSTITCSAPIHDDLVNLSGSGCRWWRHVTWRWAPDAPERRHPPLAVTRVPPSTQSTRQQASSCSAARLTRVMDMEQRSYTVPSTAALPRPLTHTFTLAQLATPAMSIPCLLHSAR